MTTVRSIAGQAGAATWIADKQSADRRSANRRAALHLEFTERSQATYLVTIERRCLWSRGDQVCGCGDDSAGSYAGLRLVAPNAPGRRDDETVMNTDRKGLSIVQLTCSGRPNMALRLRNRANSRGCDEKP
jgi:hypothetical protein